MIERQINDGLVKIYYGWGNYKIIFLIEQLLIIKYLEEEVGFFRDVLLRGYLCFC